MQEFGIETIKVNFGKIYNLTKAVKQAKDNDGEITTFEWFGMLPMLGNSVNSMIKDWPMLQSEIKDISQEELADLRNYIDSLDGQPTGDASKLDAIISDITNTLMFAYLTYSSGKKLVGNFK